MNNKIVATGNTHTHIEIHIENGSARNMRLYMWTCKNSNIKLTNMFTYDLRKTFVFILCRIICFSSYHIRSTKLKLILILTEFRILYLSNV